MCLCVWLTHFPRGPSDNRREWPLQTLHRHPPFPVGRKRWRKLNHRDFLPFPLYSKCNVHCNSDMMSLSHGAKYSLLNPQWYPKVLSEQNHTNTCKHIHTERLKQTKKANSWRLFPFIGPQSCGDVYSLVISRPLWSSPHPLEVCVHGSCEWVFMRTCECVTGGPSTTIDSSWTLSAV